MIPYGFGFNPNDYARPDLQIDFKMLRRHCKALIKMVGRSVHKKQK